MLQGLVEGRIVHYVLTAGKERPAIIVNAWDHLGRDDGYANLLVFLDGNNDLTSEGDTPLAWFPSRTYSVHGEPGTWHWPQDVVAGAEEGGMNGNT